MRIALALLLTMGSACATMNKLSEAYLEREKARVEAKDRIPPSVRERIQAEINLLNAMAENERAVARASFFFPPTSGVGTDVGVTRLDRLGTVGTIFFGDGTTAHVLYSPGLATIYFQDGTTMMIRQ